MLGRSSGCYDCKERCIGCHSVCPKYAEYKLYLQRIRERKEKERFSFPIVKRRKVYG